MKPRSKVCAFSVCLFIYLTSSRPVAHKAASTDFLHPSLFPAFLLASSRNLRPASRISLSTLRLHVVLGRPLFIYLIKLWTLPFSVVGCCVYGSVLLKYHVFCNKRVYGIMGKQGGLPGGVTKLYWIPHQLKTYQVYLTQKVRSGNWSDQMFR